jgi:hypothetical protein
MPAVLCGLGMGLNITNCNLQYVIFSASIFDMRNFFGVKPQDVLIMLKLLVAPVASQKELSNSLLISQAEVSHGLQRLKHSRLLTVEGKVSLEACAEFLIHGLKYICPAELGTFALGIPTAHSHPKFKYVKYAPNDIYVWPDAEGKVKGIALYPFYPSLPKACQQDEQLYVLASLIEMIRVGRAREQKIASDELESLIKSYDQRNA